MINERWVAGGQKFRGTSLTYDNLKNHYFEEQTIEKFPCIILQWA